MRAHARISLSALSYNLQRVRQLAPASHVMCVIKANAYGHGMLEVAQALDACDGYAVATVEEGLALRANGTDKSIIVLQGAGNAVELAQAAQARLDLVVHAAYQVEMLESAVLPQAVHAWLKVDTGMHRLGIEPDKASSMFARLQDCDSVRALSLMSHFANADDPQDSLNRQQLQQFMHATTGLDAVRSMANSAAICNHREAHLDWVRPGIMLYGVNPLLPDQDRDFNLQPVMTLSSRLLSVQQRRRGDTIGYGASWSCPQDMPVGVVSIGYGDGYPRHAQPGTAVWVNGRRASLVGRVSMDMITVDLSACPEAQVGDEVVLWGGGLPVEEIAQSSGTIAYELLCKLTSRVVFSYE